MAGKMRLKRHAPEGDAVAEAEADGVPGCVVCGAQLTSLDWAARTAHVNACIDGRAVGAEASCCTCAVCGRDLSGYTESARLHHANRCCDSLSKAGAESSPSSAAAAHPPVAASSTSSSSEPSPKRAPSSVHCAVCSKDITKLKNQTEHMKRCAKRTGMPAARLVELTRGLDPDPAVVSIPGKTVRQPVAVGPRKPKDQRQRCLGSGKENVADGTATAAAHMPTDSAIVTWLRQAGLAKYCPVFLREEIDLDALRLLDDADLQRIGISSLGPRRKILGLLAQQGQTGASVDGPIRLGASRATDSPVRLTPPMLESQLAKRHCVKVSSAAGVADAHAVAASTAGGDAEPVCEEQSSLWELASRHHAKPFEYRTVLLPVEDARAEVGRAAAVAAGAAGQASQPSGVSTTVSVDICNDDTRLAALDDLLQESSPPPRSATAGCSSTADTQSKVAGPGNAVSLGSDEVHESAMATTNPTGSDDAVEARLHVDAADTRCICANAPNSNFGASKLSSARSGSQAMWDMTDARLATVLELPEQLWSRLNEVSPQGSVELMRDSRYHTRLNALRETFLERLRLLRLDYGRQVEDVLKIIGAEGLQDTTTSAIMCIDAMDRSDVPPPPGTTNSPNTAAQMRAAVPTTVDSDFQSLPDDAIVLDEESSARLKNTGGMTQRNDSSRHDDTHGITTLDGELDHDSISLSGNSQQSTVNVLLANDWGHQEAAGGGTAEPMPKFGAMDTAELKKRVKQFGLKVSGKKVMVRQLSEIWIAQNRPRNDSTAVTTALGDTAAVQFGTEEPEITATGTSCMGPHPSSDRHAQSKLSREQILSRQVRAFVLSQPHWYTTVLLLNAIDMRALHAALSNAASLDSNMIKCSLKQLETILREQGIAFQAQS